jgi:hypothetical protein
MKLQHFSKFKVPKTISVSKGVKDELGYTNCNVNEDSCIIVEIDNVAFKNGESSYSIKLDDIPFLSNIKELEHAILKKLHEESKSIFNKEFSLEKIQSAYNSPLKEEDSELVIGINEKSKVLDQLGEDIKNTIEQYTELEGRCIIKLNCLRFIAAYIYCDWELVYFKQSPTYVEDEPEPVPDPEVPQQEEEKEESFF